MLVEYGPGGYSPDHSHAKSAFIYATVPSMRPCLGAIRNQVTTDRWRPTRPDRAFSELPGDRHALSANASTTKPAKLLAVFVVGSNETDLTIPFAN